MWSDVQPTDYYRHRASIRSQTALAISFIAAADDSGSVAGYFAKSAWYDSVNASDGGAGGSSDNLAASMKKVQSGLAKLTWP